MKIPVFENEEELIAWANGLIEAYDSGMDNESTADEFYEFPNQRLEEHREYSDIKCHECGEKVEIETKRSDYGNSYCPSCTNCFARGGYYETKAEAAEAWRKPKMEGPHIVEIFASLLNCRGHEVIKFYEGDKLWIERAKR